MHSVGIIGLGTVGARFVEQFGQHPRFTVSAAWDASPAARDRFAQQIPVKGSAQEVIAACDVVYIAVPPAAHGTYVRMAVAAGVSIFCEKPLGVDVADSTELVALVAESRRGSGINFVYASAPAATRLGSLIAAGEAGEITRIEARLQFPEWPRAWQREATWLAGATEGGWLREVGSHFVFLAHRLTRHLNSGPMSLQRAHIQRRSADSAEHRVIAELRAGSTEFLLTGASGEAGPELVEFTVFGTERSFRIREWYRLETCSVDRSEWTPVTLPDQPSPALAAYQAQLDQLDLMAEGASHTLATFDEALTIQKVVEQILQTG
jgi:1,5-anhydro-D-fructose reductase (1,5-anhydro-D-mannitol-forming)